MRSPGQPEGGSISLCVALAGHSEALGGLKGHRQAKAASGKSLVASGRLRHVHRGHSEAQAPLEGPGRLQGGSGSLRDVPSSHRESQVASERY